MRSIVIYYSQTGNTQKIALAIQQGIIRRTGQCDIARLKDVTFEELSDYDLIGVGSPVWGSKPTPNTFSFIENMPETLISKHGFFFCTHGTLPGRVIIEGVTALRKRGLIVIGWEDWYGSVFLPHMPKPYFTDGHPDSIDLKEAEDFGISIAERSLLISGGDSSFIPELFSEVESDRIYGTGAPPPPHLVSGDSPEAALYQLRINEDKCTGCMLCVDNCPIDNIDFSVTPPVFKKVDCMRCWYCEGLCPTGAIEYDFETTSRSGDKGHLEHMRMVLDEAEKNGRFRRLVAVEKVGWDTPWWKISKHPRITLP